MATNDQPPTLSNEDAISFGRRVGVGCFTLFVGVWSGAMVGVLIGKVVEAARKAPSCEGLPTCNWYIYAIGGAVVGALTLPSLVFWRLERGKARGSNLRG
ncbi:MAG: hypothetical protein IT361_08470 [Gemmatimonadaceae bacterium]|nr:hypothetical protein [Gemmatimonadaceae bacterium]